MEDVDSPLVAVRPVKKVLLVIVTGDRGLCGGYNNFIIKKVSFCLLCSDRLSKSHAAKFIDPKLEVCCNYYFVLRLANPTVLQTLCRQSSVQLSS